MENHMMDAYTKRLFRRKIPTLVATGLFLLFGTLMKLVVG
jgi:hypothetical protein